MGAYEYMKHHKKIPTGAKLFSSAITGKETMAELFNKAFGAFVGREVKSAYKIIRRMIIEDHAIVLTFSGALTLAF